jgi:acetyl esterase/lipase
MRKGHRAALLAGLGSLVLCSLLTALSLWRASHPPRRKPTRADVIYTQGEGNPQALDLYLPEGEGPWPVVIWIHGGGWTAGDRAEGADVAAGLVPMGYAVVSIDYRLAPQHPFPAAIADTQCAVAWVKRHAADYRLDAAHVALMGGSAGGHLAALAALVAAPSAPPTPWTPSCETDGLDLTVQAVVSFAGPMDLESFSQPPAGRDAVQTFLGCSCAEDAALCTAASPITYASADAPPFLLIHGLDDPIVPPLGSQQMAETLTSLGVEALYLPLDGVGHEIQLDEEAARTLGDFLSRHLKGVPLSP